MQAVVPLLGRSPLSRRPLLRPGLLRLPLIRAQVSTLSTEIGADGVWRERAADFVRFVGARRRLLVEPQRTNLITNPRGEGLAPGTPGTVPTGWNVTNATGGITRRIVGAATENGVQCVDVEFTCVAVASGIGLMLASTSLVSAATGTLVTGGAYLRILSGTPPSLVGWLSQTGGANQLSGNFALPATLTRSVSKITIPGGGGAGANFILTNRQAGYTGVFAVRFGWPHIEIGAYASTPILPPVDTPGAAARGADLIAPTLASLGIPAGGDCTLVFDLMIPQAAPSGVNQTILMLDDATTDNRFVLHNPAGGATVVPFRTTGGNVTSGGSAGTFTPGAQFRVATCIKAGRIAASVAGGAVVATTGGPTSGLTTARIGNNLTATGSLAGEIAAIDLLPPVPDGVLRALSAGAL